MEAIPEHPSRGRPAWPAEVALRAVGLALIGACLLALRWDCCLAAASPQSEGTPLEFAVAALCFASLVAGLAFILEGPGLFRRVPLPPRALLP